MHGPTSPSSNQVTAAILASPRWAARGILALLLHEDHDLQVLVPPAERGVKVRVGNLQDACDTAADED